MDEVKKEELKNSIEDMCKKKFYLTNDHELNQINSLVNDVYNRISDILGSTREISPKVVENFCEDFKYLIGSTVTKLNFESMEQKIDMVCQNLENTFKRDNESKEQLANESDLAIKDGVRDEKASYEFKLEEEVVSLVDSHFNNLNNFPSYRVVEASDEARRITKEKVIQTLKEIHHQSSIDDLKELEVQVEEVCNEFMKEAEEKEQDSFRIGLNEQTKTYEEMASDNANQEKNKDIDKSKEFDEYSI